MTKSAPSRILIVDDSESVRSTVARYLKEKDYSVIEATDGIQGLKRALSDQPDLIILDVVMPGIEGPRLCQILRERGIETPIIMLTEKSSLKDKVVGFESGGNDYVAKPFSSEELELRVRAQLRGFGGRETQAPPKLVVIGGLRIDFEKRLVSESGKDITLTPTEFRILELLAATPGRAYSRQELLNFVWDSAFEGYKRNIDPHVNRLRSKLEPNPVRPTYVLTVWGVGYKLNDAIRQSVSEEAKFSSN